MQAKQWAEYIKARRAAGRDSWLVRRNAERQTRKGQRAEKKRHRETVYAWRAVLRRLEREERRSGKRYRGSTERRMVKGLKLWLADFDQGVVRPSLEEQRVISCLVYAPEQAAEAAEVLRSRWAERSAVIEVQEQAQAEEQRKAMIKEFEVAAGAGDYKRAQYLGYMLKRGTPPTEEEVERMLRATSK